MKFGPVPLAAAAGHMLAHKLLGPDGRPILRKGHVLTPADLEHLASLGLETVVVAALEPADLDENTAAQRVGAALAGAGVRHHAPGVGRANLHATVHGPLRINVPALHRLNMIDEGITVATLHTHTLVQAGQQIALVKVIPFGVAAARVADVVAIAQDSAPLLAVRAMPPCAVGLIITGPPGLRAQMLVDFGPPVQARVEALGSRLAVIDYVAHEVAPLAAAIAQHAATCDLLIIGGISATIDRADCIPTALSVAGGSVTHFGTPVDPGSLLVLGYRSQVPVLGAPGCLRSPRHNVVDMLLPRLLAGERLTRAAIIELGHGGLLKDIPERPMPRHADSAAD